MEETWFMQWGNTAGVIKVAFQRWLLFVSFHVFSFAEASVVSKNGTAEP